MKKILYSKMISPNWGAGHSDMEGRPAVWKFEERKMKNEE